MKENKVVRSKNLSSTEKEKLVNLIVKYKEILECKETDKVNAQKKKATWLKIVNEFNAINSSKRSVDQIRNFYKNSKSELRKQLSANRAANFRTGGGTREVVLDENNPLLAVVTEQTFCIPNEFDSSRDLFGTEHKTNNEDDTENHNVMELEECDTELSPGNPTLRPSTGRISNLRRKNEVEKPNKKDDTANQNVMELEECDTELSLENPTLRPSTGRISNLRRKNEVEKELQEIKLLKRAKIEAEIEKTKLKCELYRIKLKVLSEIENEYCRRKDE